MYYFLIKSDGLIYSSGKDRSYFPQSLQHLVKEESEILELPLERQFSIYNKNAEIPLESFDSKEHASEMISKLLSNFKLTETIMSKRNKDQAEAAAAEAAPTNVAEAGADKASRSRTPKTAVIRIKAEKNPKREGSSAHQRFALYKDGMTVGEFLEAGGTMGDINFDSNKGFIALEGVESQADVAEAA